MLTRFAVACGWLVAQLQRLVGWLPGPPQAPILALIGLLVILSAVPIVASFLEEQPQSVGVEAIVNDQVTQPELWVRLRGSIEPLPGIPADVPGTYALLRDAEDPQLAVLLRADPDEQLREEDQAVVTGHVEVQAVEVPGFASARAAAAGQRIVSDRVVAVEMPPHPEPTIAWALVLLPLLVAGVLGLGLRAGYPLWEETREVDVLAKPLAPGERLPIAVAGKIGGRQIPLAEPAEALLLVARGAKGPALTVQLLDEAGRYVAPIAVGGGWTRARVGYVHTVREHVPALALQAEETDATLLFATTAERDRVTGLVAIER